MGVLSESWCFCKGLGKSERTKAAIFSTKSPAMARISGAGTGFLIHRNLLLTTHANLPSVAAAESAEIRLQNDVAATLVPHRFFITSSVLDLTIVGLDTIDGDSNAQAHPHYLKTCSKPSLDLGSGIFLLGYTDKKDLSISEGKVVIATDNLIKLSTDGITLSPGSAGFDMQGNLAFMICDPMKLATSPNTKSSSTSSSSSDFPFPMQFGIPVPIIIDWLNQHWEGSLDELNKPKLPIMRLMSSGQKSEHSCASFTLRQVFKSAEEGEGGKDGTVTPSSSNRARDLPETCHAPAAHQQGIPTPEIYESPKLIPVPTQKKQSPQVQLLDINFPPLITKAPVPPKRDQPKDNTGSMSPSFAEIASVNDPRSECQSSSSPIELSEMQNGYSSEGETMYSAETAESRNYTTPREGKSSINMMARRASLETQRSAIHGRKVQSLGATSQRSNDYYSPTVSSIMKKRNNVEQAPRARQSSAHTSPRWNF